MAEIVNLNRQRKAHAKREASARADENRALHGRTKAERALEAAVADRLRRTVEGARLEPGPDDPPGGSKNSR